MAIFHQHMQVIGKSSGRSAVAAAAYRSGLKLQEDIIDKETGLTTTQTWDYSKKQGVVFSQIYAPENAPEWVYDREALWNRVMHRESRKDAQYSREMDIALPVELTEEQNKELMAEIVKKCYVKHGMIADANLHLDNPENPHFHVMLTMRDLVTQEDGSLEFGLKNREWNKKEFVLKSREKTAEIINKHLEFYGHLSRVSHLSHKDRGIDLIPTIHVGVAHHINGTERRQLNAEIIAENAKMIAENPELLFDKLSINNPVFTKEEIAIALHEVLTNVRGSDGKVVGNEKEVIIDEAIKDEIKELIKGDNRSEIKEEIGLGSALEEVSENQKIATEFMTCYTKLMNSDKIIMVLEKDLKDRTLYGLSKRIELEARFTEVVERLKNTNNHVLNLQEADLQKPSSLLESLLAQERANLSKEQAKAVLEIVNGPDIVALQGLPGAGKTTVMKEVVRQYKKAGKTVIGLATSENAAVNLGSIAGIEAMNIDKFRKNMQGQGKGDQNFELPLRMDFYNEELYQKSQGILTDQHVLIVDEASMLELSRSHYLNLEVAKARAKIIKLGDLNQFAPVGLAGAFKKECEVLKVSQLTEVRRQQNPEHVKATALLAQYDIDGFLKLYEQEGSIKVFESNLDAKKGLVKDYIDSYIEKANQLDRDDLVGLQDKVITICAHTNKVVKELNQLVRRQLKQAGIIKGLEVDVVLGDKRLKLAKGEQIIFGQNSKKLGVLNGEIGTILKIKEVGDLGATIITVKVQRADGSSDRIKIDSREKYVYRAIDYGYAVTAYKLQGTTVDKNFIYYEPNVGYEGINVMMTRHRESVGLYAGKKELEEEVYKRIAEEPELVRELYSIKAEQELWKIGMGLSMHKRTNLSFVADYAGMGLSREDKRLKAYIEARGDLGKALKQISAWQERQLKLTGNKAAMWQHENWQLVLLYKQVRDSSAQVICDNYPDYRDRIIQLNLNYQTIKKHAGLDEGYRVEKLDQPSQLVCPDYVNLIKQLTALTEVNIQVGTISSKGLSRGKILESGLTKAMNSVVQAFKILKEDIGNRELEIEVLEGQINDTCQKRYMIEDQINHIERFNEQLLPEFLKRVYRNPTSEILEKWHKLVNNANINVAVKQVEENPRILGELKGIGIGSWIGFTSLRSDAIANISTIRSKLEEYQEGLRALPELKDSAGKKQELLKEDDLIADKMRLRALLPNRNEQEFLNQLGMVVEPLAKILDDKQLDQGQFDGKGLVTLLEKLQIIANSEFVQDEILAIQVKEAMGTDYSVTEATKGESSNNALLVKAELFVDGAGSLTTKSAFKQKEYISAPAKLEALVEQGLVKTEILELYLADLKNSRKGNKQEYHLTLEQSKIVNSPEEPVVEKSELEIIEDNVSRILLNPQIVFEKISNDRPVFTEGDMEIAIRVSLTEKLDHQGKVIGNITSKQADIEQDDNILPANAAQLEQINQQLTKASASLMDELTSHKQVVLIAEQGLKGERLFALAGKVELEEKFILAVNQLNNSDKHAINIGRQDFSKQRAHKTTSKDLPAVQLNSEQQQAIIQLLQGSDIVALEGFPGAGKSTVMQEVVRQLQQAGLRVTGVAPSSKAALNLAEAAGIKAWNSAQLRKIWQEGVGQEFTLKLKRDFYKQQEYLDGQTMLTDKDVLIIDEASMLNLADNLYFLLEAIKAEAKVILVGDNNQFAAIEDRGSFKKICEIANVSCLTEVIRQKNPEHARATCLLGQYKVGEALDIYAEEGCLLISASAELAQSKLVKDYIDCYIELAEATGQEDLAASQVICAYTNKVVNEFNQQVRLKLKQAGILKGFDVTVKLGSKTIKLMRGEQIIFGQNSKKLGVINGQLGTVLEVIDTKKDEQVIIIAKVTDALGIEKKVLIDSKDNYQAINYGYAVTAYKLQGTTVDKNFVYFEKGCGYQWANVALTRHRDSIKVYANLTSLEDEIFNRLSHDSQQAREEYDIKAERPAYLLGLGYALSKATDCSFSSDYVGIGQSSIDQNLKQYLAASKDFANKIKEFSKWQQQQLQLTGKKPEIFEHEAWEEAVEIREERDKLAGMIVEDRLAYATRMRQYNINYQTTQKHAGCEEYSYQAVARDLVNFTNQHYVQVIENIASVNQQTLASLMGSLEQLQSAIAAPRQQMLVVTDKLTKIAEHKINLQDQINKYEHFSDKLLPEFLKRVYVTSPKLVMQNWQDLIQKVGIKQASMELQHNPNLLGDTWLCQMGDSNKARNRDVAINLGQLASILQEYEAARQAYYKAEESLSSAEMLKEKRDLSLEKIELQKVLPNIKEQKFIDLLSKAAWQYRQVESEDKLLSEIQAIVSSQFVQKNIMKYARQNDEIKSPELQGLNASYGLKGRRNSLAYNSLKPRSTRRKESLISFVSVKQALTGNDYQQIFTTYATAINPDGLVRKQGNNMMCGSLSMSLQSGLWMRHSSGDKGDIFHFVAVAMGKTKRQALKQLAKDLGFREENGQLVRSENTRVAASSIVGSKETFDELTSGWVAIKLVPEDAPPFNPEKHLAYLCTNNNLTATYQYLNKEGKLVGYVVRLEDKTTGKKQVLPVSYCYNKDLGKRSWKLKGFTDESGYKPIYGEEKLTSSKPMLIVEGEKTAIKAQSLLPEYTVISWLGGSKAAGNVNWQLLAGRDVVIWPDNDSPGFAAAKVIQQKLSDIASSCLVVDPRVLGMPQKWDLGDAKPKDLSMIKGALVNSYIPGSIKFIDQQIKALDHQNLSNDQLISLLEKEVIIKLRLEGKASKQYLTRMQEELEVISRTGFGADFVIAANIAKYCSNMNIARGPGRGSSVSSLVAYGLGIHKIDPIKNNLLFERFLTIGTRNNPDFDFDIAASKKVLLENYVLAKYSNASKLSVISNKGEEEVKTIHPSGIGIIPNHLKEQLPYSKVKGNFWASQSLLDIDHKQAELLGVKKFDLLSSQVIEGIEKVEHLIRGKDDSVIDWHKIGWKDSKAFALIKSADTEGIYQLGSNFAKEVAAKVRLEKFKDLVNLLALIRPGSKNYIRYFADNNEAQKRFSGFSDPKNIFKDTKGIILFQEQVMQAGHSYLGVDKSETNQFRKELEKDSSSHPLVDKENFIKTSMEQGLRQQDAANLYYIMKEFSKFGYNKSHAIAYAQVTFKTAYLKAHHPEQFQEIFKSKGQVVTKEQIVIDIIKGTINDQVTYEEQIITPKVDTKIGLIEVSAGAYPHHDVTILASNLDQALAIKQSGISARILCMRGIDSLKHYQVKSNERVLLVANNDDNSLKSSEVIAKTTEDLEAKGAIVSCLCPKIQRDFDNIVQQDDMVGSLKIYKSFNPVIESLQAKTIDEFLSIKGEAYLGERARQDLAVIRQYEVNEDKILQGFLRGYDKGIDSIQKVKSDIATIEKLMVKHHPLVEEIEKFDERKDHFSIVGSLVTIGNASSHLDSLCNIRNQALTNYLSSNLARFSQQITQANTVSDIINIYEQRQLLLISLGEKLVRGQGNEIIDNMLKEAGLLAQTKVIEKLPKIVENIENHNLMSNKELVEMLKHSRDLTATCHSLEKKHEQYCITSHLAKLAKAKQEAKTVQIALKALEKEQEYLTSLHGKIKDPYYKGSSLAQSVKHAYRNNQDNIITQLHKLTAYLDKPSVKQEHITNIIKTSTHSGEALHNLTKQYHKHVISELKSCLEHIYDRKELTLDGHKFTKPLQLMDYVLKKHEHNEFFPKEHIQNGRNNYAQYQKEISKSKEFGGPSL